MKIPNLKIDKTDRHLLDMYSFCDNGNGYIVAWADGKYQYLHRMILGDKKGLEIDHINGDKLDNRRENLRHVTHQQNIFNMRTPKTNKTGVKGVTFDARINKWIARIAPNRQSKHLGSFPTIQEAITARKSAELIYAQ